MEVLDGDLGLDKAALNNDPVPSDNEGPLVSPPGESDEISSPVVSNYCSICHEEMSCPLTISPNHDSMIVDETTILAEEDDAAVRQGLQQFCESCLCMITRSAEEFNNYCEHLLANVSEDCDLPAAWSRLLPQLPQCVVGMSNRRTTTMHQLKTLNQKAIKSWLRMAQTMINHSQSVSQKQGAKYHDECVRRWMFLARKEYNRVSRISLLNYIFYIWQQGEFGTINHLRLGRLPEIQVPIPEINAAFGNVAFLMNCILRRLPVILHSHIGKHPIRPKSGRIMVKGSSSYVTKWEDDQVHLPLYLPESSVTWYFHIPKFNQAVSALLDNYVEIIDSLRLLKANLQPVMPVQNGTVAGCSVKYKSGEERIWTAALRYFLINLKWLIGIVAEFENLRSLDSVSSEGH
eukprot:Gregarina_sp_Pseudo_9__99@NODE_1065_length_1910_cov_10_547301_g997_i0_p1_GENE_NODE_1065_length_1910_cov_10_547301_g997_i0NODE_1065_length_1910_cov_10_547301_g997_i0_p1_ORF_typecomplete_len404_score19_56APG6/PF04111_12/1_3e39Atg14/PF10186_9/0_049_NODE_1065_length_1910_cov_10_547301_g997_i06541865